MELILSSITTAIGNLIVFSFIPLIWWFIKHRKNEGFFKWIGLYKLKLKSKWWVLIIFGVIYYFIYDFDYTQLFDQSTIENIGNSSSVAANAFNGIGIWFHIVLFTFTRVGALLLGLLNEKIYNGSIVPSILLHGAGNFIASMLVAFA
jgi:hypothetical protein